MASDERLVALVREGKGAAFEAAYDRHHRAILSFCRHMLGSLEEAEDAVQHTFLAAYNDLISSHKPIHLRAWLFTIARNRCYSILRARREQPLGELDEPATEGLATQVQRRQDLRDLVGDLRRLPDEQRAALVLSEMDSLSHEQIADVLGVPKDKVKALVFQARESLVASRAARETDCAEIREQLANLRGGALRRANLRRHLHECAGCREFRHEVERQRRQLRVLLPVAPTLALKEAVLGATVGGGAAVTAGGGGGGVFAGSMLKGGVVKGLLGAALAGVGTAGTIVAVHDFQVGVGSGFRFGGSHQLTSRAPFTPAPPTEARKGLGSTSSYRSTSASQSAGAVGSYAARGAGASAHSYTGTAAATTIAVLHPLSRKGLTSTLIPSPLLPPAAVSGPGSSVAGHAVHSPTTSSSEPIPPYLAPSAFGSGDQGSTGGTRSTSSNQGVAPSSSGSGAGTSQIFPSGTGSSGGGSGSSGYSVSGGSAGANSGATSHASAPSSSGSSSAGSSAISQGPSGKSGFVSGSGGSRGGSSSGASGSGSTAGSSSSSGVGSGSDSSVASSGSSGAGSTGSGDSGAGSGSGSTGASNGSGYGGGTNTAPHGR